MRYRVLSRGKAKHLSIPEKPAEKTASLKAADLDNLFALTAPDLKYYLLSKRAGLVVSSSGLWYTY